MTSTALARLSPERAIEVLRAQIAPKASDGELAYFAQVCQRLDLSPFADQIVLIGRFDSRAGREVHRHQITIAGRRTLATRTGKLAGIEGPVWCGPRAFEGAPLEWVDLWDDDAAPYAARCLVWRHDWIKPANGTAKWTEFAQTTGDPPRLLRAWRAMPSHMLGKVAESMALRRAFPDTITADAVDGFEGMAPRSFVPADDAAELEDAAASAGADFPPDDVVDLEDVSNELLTDTGGTGDRPAGSTASRAPGPAGGPYAGSIVNVPPLDQGAAHRAVAALGPDGCAAWLEGQGLDDFGSVWPDDAVRAALEMPFDGPAQ